MTRNASILAAFIVVVAAACGAPHDAARYQTAQVTRETLVQHVTASGTLSAVVSVDVGSQVSGKIAALYVDFNSAVRKGQPIAQIDPTIYNAILRQARADLASAKADVLLKRQSLARTKILTPLRAASQLDLDQATAQLAQSDAAVELKQAVLESAAGNLNYCRIIAPVDGVVISRKVDVGQTVIAAMTTPVLFTIAQDISAMNISAQVSEADIGHVRPGQPVEFTVDAYPDEVFHGQVSQVRKAPTTTQNVVTYETLIAIKNPNQELFPGMTADVSILVAQRFGILELPNAALRYTPSQDTAFVQPPPAKLGPHEQLVYAPEDQERKLRPLVVKTGITDGVHTEVVDGISEGTSVVIAMTSSAVKASPLNGPPPRPP